MTKKLEKLWARLTKARLLKWKIVRVAYHKGEPYAKYLLVFRTPFGTKEITYDLTMFDDWGVYEGHWNDLINNGTYIPLRDVKDRKIF